MKITVIDAKKQPLQERMGRKIQVLFDDPTPHGSQIQLMTVEYPTRVVATATTVTSRARRSSFWRVFLQLKRKARYIVSKPAALSTSRPECLIGTPTIKTGLFVNW
jgi:hypothetical protein